MKSWIDYMDETFRHYDMRIALIDHDGRRCWSYTELLEEGERLAAILRELGVSHNDCVALYSKNRVEHITLLLACARLGAILVPLNYRLASREIKDIIMKTAPQLILFEGEFCQEGMDHFQCLNIESFLKRKTTKKIVEPAVVPLDHPLLMLFSSGTTGEPKGILLHGQMIRTNQIFTCAEWGLKEDDVTLVSTPFFHTGGYNVLCLPLLHLGGTVVLVRDFKADDTLNLINQYKVSVYFGVPSIFEMLSKHNHCTREMLSSVRFFVSGGAYCSVTLIKTFQQLGVEFKQGFGLSEVGPNCFLLEAKDSTRKVGSIGKPMAHSKVRLLGDDGDITRAGEVGELLLAGDHVCAGYFRDRALFANSCYEGFFKTGDLARFDEDGFFYIVGRKKEMFISGGENVYPAEVEKAVNEHESILSSVVVPVADAKWGEVGLVYVVGNKVMCVESLRAFLNSSLSRYKHPQYIVNVERIPLLDNGKIDRNKLKKYASFLVTQKKISLENKVYDTATV